MPQKAVFAALLRSAALVSMSLALTANALAQTCNDEAGREEAQLYVDQCIEVSPATRPPCNAEDPAG